VLDWSARLLPPSSALLDPEFRPMPDSWTVTFGLGKPAAGTYSEVRFAPEVLDRLGRIEALDGFGLDAHAREVVLDAVVRRVAAFLYGTAWAFHYRPDEYPLSIARYDMRCREVVLVESVEVYA
jgi:hypothetical protein